MKATFADFELTKQLDSALEKLKITNPTPIQEKSFKPILSAISSSSIGGVNHDPTNSPSLYRPKFAT